jgi:hypothetical protein
LNVGESSAAGGQTQGITYQLYNPFEAGASFEGPDQGIDVAGPPGGHVLAIGDGHVYAHHPNPTAGPGFGESLYYTLDHFGEAFYVGHAKALVTTGDPVTAGQKIAQLQQRPFGNAPTDPWHTEVGFAYGAAPTYPNDHSGSGGHAFEKWMTAYGISAYGSHTGRTTKPPVVPPSQAVGPSPAPTPLPGGGGTKNAPVVSQWRLLLDVFKTRVPKQAVAAKAVFGNPKGWMK